MQILDLPLTTLILILFGMLALFTFVVSIRMPGNYDKDEQIRSELRKKIYEVDEQNKTEDDQAI